MCRKVYLSAKETEKEMQKVRNNEGFVDKLIMKIYWDYDYSNESKYYKSLCIETKHSIWELFKLKI